MGFLKLTAKKFILLFVIMLAVFLISTVVIVVNIDKSLDERLRQVVQEEISEDPTLCENYSSMDECIDVLVKQKRDK